MGTLKIGSASNKKGVTIEPKTVLFNGDNVKYIMSGLTEIWSNIKALISPMTSNTTPSGVASCSSRVDSTFEAWKAFDGNTTSADSAWISGSGSLPHWLCYQFTMPTVVKKFKVTNRNATGASIGCIKEFTLQGSNDNSQWVNIKSFVIPESENGAGVEHTFDVNENDNAYLYYRLSIASYYGSYASIGELQMYGSQLKAILVPMTTYSNEIGTVSATSEYNGNGYGSAYYSIDYHKDGLNWFEKDQNTNTGCYVQFMFNKDTSIKVIRYRFGTAHTTSFTTKAKAQYTLNGNDWYDIENSEKEYSGAHVSNRVFVDCNLTNVIGIRIINTYKGASSCFSVSDIQVYK